MTFQRVILLLAALALASATLRLGVWQLDRAAQKAALQSAIDSRRELPPLGAGELAGSAAGAEGQHHRRVLLEGRWLREFTVYLENRQMNGRPGFFVVTPLLLADGSAVLVQRGWQPRDAMERARVVEPATPAGKVSLTGRIAPPPARLYEFDGAASGPIRQNLPLDAFAQETGLTLKPFSVLQLDTSPPAADGLLRDWLQPAADVHKHYGYAFQWFALAALTIGLYVWFQILRPGRHPR
jgi:surfeit locus 1 family protein